MSHDAYDDALIRSILTRVKTIAIVGASANPARASHHVAEFLIERGYEVYPVNPGLAGKDLLGRPVFASLADVPVAIDMVDVFRNSDAVAPVVDQAIAVGAKVVWMQLGVRNDAAAAKAEAAGLEVVMNRCPAIEIPRLGM
ncbi:MAG: CoA-binding protein [Hyphomicrobiales bacterium]|nr:CoA-binding protein [Hyphomicrobiales bacterium]